MPEQAVILCGGLGTRLRPLTDNIPKPMALVNGKPFLHHLICQIRESGINSFILLTGYRGEMIREYFGTGENLGVKINYDHGPVEWDTGRRLWEAQGKFASCFLLLYSDNFAQFNIDRLLQLHVSCTNSVSLLLAPKEAGNIHLTADGLIDSYDRTRSGNHLKYVELGYMLVEKKKVLHEFPQCDGFPDISFSAILERLACQKQLAGLVVRDPYHSISDLKRLELMRQYLKPKKILLIDRDGTLNHKAPTGKYILSWQQFEFISDSLNAMKWLSDLGFHFIVITNQAGVARNMLTAEELDDIHTKMISQLAFEGISVLKVYVSPHHWDENSYERKPQPGLFFKAAADFNLRMDRILYVGDDQRDCIAAANAGCGMVFLTQTDQQPDLAEYPQPFLQSPLLSCCKEQIVSIYSNWEASS